MVLFTYDRNQMKYSKKALQEVGNTRRLKVEMGRQS